MRSRLGWVLVLLTLLATACSASTEVTGMDGQSADTGDDATDNVALSGPGVGELSSEKIFESIENSVVYVLAPDEQTSGSGIVIDGGWILTNAHVVDRHQTVRIGRSDGQDLGEHPVHAVDWIFDLALVGPVTDSQLMPIARGESGKLSLGSRVLMAGFPDEYSVAPTPTLTEGIVSRRRFMALGDYPFLQVDATIAPGQSGGALVNGNGELVGISGLEFGEGEFGLAFASDPMWPRINEMITLGSSQLPTGPPVFEVSGEVGPLHNFSFGIQVGPSEALDLAIVSDADVWVDVQTMGGTTISQVVVSEDPFRLQGTDGQLYFDELVEGGENVLADVEPGTYQVLIGSFGNAVDSVQVTSANEIRSFADLEEGQLMATDVILEGEFDWVRDTDLWELVLAAGDQVTITADGLADTLVVVRFDDVMVASSDDEGLGLFGTGSKVEFTAADSGTYIVEVGTFDQTRWGYLIEATVS